MFRTVSKSAVLLLLVFSLITQGCATYDLSHSWSLLGGLFENDYGAGIVDSPIVTLRYQLLIYFGAGWRF